MHVYRYRKSDTLSLKGLLYDEWYFASKDELNDPIDMQSRYEFAAHGWHTLLSGLWSDATHIEIAENYFKKISPISYEQLIENFEEHTNQIMYAVFNSIQRPIKTTDIFGIRESLNKLLELIKLYCPRSSYSVSLSRTDTEMLMWSHYAYNHTGFCLVYRPINGKLRQCPSKTKNSLTVSRGHDSVFPSEFKIEDIIYDNHLQPLDAYKLLPVIYNQTKDMSEAQRLDWHRSVDAQLLTKNRCWSYEKECRLMLPQPNNWVSGRSSFNSLQRLFYYDFNQLVGVIFGARMPEKDKQSVRNIIDQKLQVKSKNLGNRDGKCYIFDFLYQQAEICSSSRQLKIIDLDIHTLGQSFTTGHASYGEFISKWKNFEGLTFENSGCSRESIPL